MLILRLALIAIALAVALPADTALAAHKEQAIPWHWLWSSWLFGLATGLVVAWLAPLTSPSTR